MTTDGGRVEAAVSESRPRWHALEAADVLTRVGSSPEGLTTVEAASRRADVGPNVVERKRRESPLRILFRQVNDPLIWVLVASSLVAIIVGRLEDGLVVAAVVAINTTIGFVQELKASRAIEALSEMVPELTTVLRDGQPVDLPVADLVPGDIVMLASGNRVPADLRLLEAKSLRCEEAALTGESVPVDKSVAPVAEAASLGDRASMAIGGTLVAAGTGMAVTVATGARTELGRVAQLLEKAADLKTPLTLTLAKIGKFITIGVLVLAAVTVAVATARGVVAGQTLGAALVGSAMFAISLAVGAIPEGLPAIVTVALAIGVRRMAARGAIVRRLPAIETLGSTTIVCSDKTGTLTRNEMTVQQVVVGGRTIEIAGIGYEPVGAFSAGGKELPEPPSPLSELLRDAALASDATLDKASGRWQITGDPTEAALVVAAQKAGVDVAAARTASPRLDVVPFDSELQFMATLHGVAGSTPRLLVKGAPEVIAARASSRADGTMLDAAALDREVRTLADQGMRVLAIGAREWPGEVGGLGPEDAQDLELLGLVGMIDPPRPEAIEAIQACHAAGMTVKMITGDHPRTAAAIGRALGLITSEQAIAGDELEQMDDAELRRAVDRTHVFARVSPEQKFRLVCAMQSNGAVVAMTGDGVNDAPALKQANVGIAMGITGTSVAKESADIVLTDDKFTTIIGAVEEGRRVYDNLVKSLAFALPTNLGLALIVIAAVAFFPLDAATLELLQAITPTQILWINLVASVALAVPLAFEAAEPDVMRRPPRDPKASPLSGFVIFRTVLVAALMAAGAIGLSLYEYTHELGRGQPRLTAIANAQTMAVTAVVFFQIFYLLHCRSLHASLREIGVFKNPVVFMGIAALLGLQALFVYAPFMHSIFESTSLSIHQIALAALVGATILPVITLEKAIRRRRMRAARSVTEVGEHRQENRRRG